MGNCMETLRNSPSEEKHNNIVEEEEEEEVVEEEKRKKMRIKIVLRKEEVEWLMFELQKTQGMKIEDVLLQIQTSRLHTTTTAVPWKPSLDSILETPEVMPMDRYIN